MREEPHAGSTVGQTADESPAHPTDPCQRHLGDAAGETAQDHGPELDQEQPKQDAEPAEHAAAVRHDVELLFEQGVQDAWKTFEHDLPQPDAYAE